MPLCPAAPAAATATARQGPCCPSPGRASPPHPWPLPQPCNTTFFDAISGASSDTGLFEQGLSLAGAKDKLPDPNALPVGAPQAIQRAGQLQLAAVAGMWLTLWDAAAVTQHAQLTGARGRLVAAIEAALCRCMLAQQQADWERCVANSCLSGQLVLVPAGDSYLLSAMRVCRR